MQIIYGSRHGLSGADDLWTLNSPGIKGTSSTGDRFGMSLATGDFDGDGFSDLAAGVPGDNVDGSANAGSALVLYGSEEGLSDRDQLWRQNSPRVPGVVEAGDAFGASLAAGDFNGDGRDDLAIGASAEALGAKPLAGAATVLLGSKRGLTAVGSRAWHQNSSGIKGVAEIGDEFSAALSVGDFDGDGYADLAVGVPGEQTAAGHAAGVVNVIFGGANGLTTRDQMRHQDSAGIKGVSERADRFGETLTTGDYDGDGYADLAVGVPHEANGSLHDSGAVNIMFGGRAGLTTRDLYLTQDTAGISGVAGSADRFASSLFSGDYDADGFADLAVGVEGEAVGGPLKGAGGVNVIFGDRSGRMTRDSAMISQALDGVEGNPEAGDGMGSLDAMHVFEPGAHDADPPNLRSFDFSPKTVNVAEARAIVTVSMTITDATGVVAPGVRFAHEHTGQTSAAAQAQLLSGSTFDGTWQAIVEIPMSADPGSWLAELDPLQDVLGNTGPLGPTTGPTELEVVSVAVDYEPPELVSFDFSPKNVNVAEAPGTVTVSMHITDATGVLEPAIRFTHETTGQTTPTAGAELVSGSVLDGMWEATVEVPMSADVGTWMAELDALEDELGNTGQPGPTTGPTQLQVESTPIDDDPPQLVFFEFQPRTVDVTTQPAMIVIEIAVSDETGSEAPLVWFIHSVTAEQTMTATGVLETGTPDAGLWKATVEIPTGATPGTWLAQLGPLADILGNSGTAGPPSVGPTNLTVTSQPNTADCSTSTDAVAYWCFDDETSPTTDGAGEHHAYLDGPAFETADIAPVSGNLAAIRLDGANDFAAVSDPGGAQDLDGFTAITLAAWVSPDDTQSSDGCCGGIVTKYASGDLVSWGLDIQGAEIRFVYPGAEFSSSGVDLILHEWRHVAATWDGSDVRLYVDGQEVAHGQDLFTAMPNADVDVNIGAFRAFAGGQRSAFFSGLIDEVYVFDRALNAVEIQALISG